MNNFTDVFPNLSVITCNMIDYHIDCHYDTIQDGAGTTSHCNVVSGTVVVFEVADEHRPARDAEASTQHTEHHVLEQHSSSE